MFRRLLPLAGAHRHLSACVQLACKGTSDLLSAHHRTDQAALPLRPLCRPLRLLLHATLHNGTGSSTRPDRYRPQADNTSKIHFARSEQVLQMSEERPHREELRSKRLLENQTLRPAGRIAGADLWPPSSDRRMDATAKGNVRSASRVPRCSIQDGGLLWECSIWVNLRAIGLSWTA